MNFLLNRKLFEANIKVRNWEKKELYRDENIAVIVPLTHNALTKYAMNCQWCINSDRYEFDEYHKDKTVLIVQRKHTPSKKGLYGGYETTQEIHDFEKYIEGSFHMEFLQDIQKYNIDEDNIEEAVKKLTSDITNYRMGVVYYNIEDNNIVDMGNNYMKKHGYTINDIPNITQKAIESIQEYKNGNDNIYDDSPNEDNLYDI